ncbi:hypothetical protein AJ87_13575 [Rhizobium yanglingense]|nr:hypothetical protein AJ87_13575 [Rhizobium yanglingense]
MQHRCSRKVSELGLQKMATAENKVQAQAQPKHNSASEEVSLSNVVLYRTCQTDRRRAAQPR